MTRKLTQQEVMTLEKWESIRFYIILTAGLCTVGAMVISAYLSMKKPGVQTSV